MARVPSRQTKLCRSRRRRDEPAAGRFPVDARRRSRAARVDSQSRRRRRRRGAGGESAMRISARAYVLGVASTVRSRTACSDGHEVELNARRPMSPTRDLTVAATLGSQRGFALVDCVAYIGLLAVILTMAFAAFYRALERSRDLSRNAAEIVRALQAGERWRADVRASARPPQL